MELMISDKLYKYKMSSVVLIVTSTTKIKKWTKFDFS